MDGWVVVSVLNRDVLSFEEFMEVLPVVDLLVKLKSIVVLVHLYFIWEVSREDLCEDPAVRQVSLGVGYFVGEVERLQPQVQLSRQGYHIVS